MTDMDKNAKIFVAGHRGMVGSAILRKLQSDGFTNLVVRSRSELDLLDASAVKSFFEREKPEFVFLAAAKVGGINANMTKPADFLHENLMIQNNVIHQSLLSGVKKLCFLGSSCIYPRECPQPIREEYLLTGPLEPTNEGYAIAKIAGYKMCLYYARQHGMKTVSLMPCNLYGKNDDFDLSNCHVLSALTRRLADAVDEKKDEVVLWGTGTPTREFLNVDDMADASVLLMRTREDPEIINVGSGHDISIRELAEKIAAAAGFGGNIRWDPSKPDGMPKKCMDVSKLTALGWKPKISLDQGVRQMLDEYRALKKAGRV